MEWLRLFGRVFEKRVHWFSCYVFRTRDQKKKLFRWLTTPMVNHSNGFFSWSRVRKTYTLIFLLCFSNSQPRKEAIPLVNYTHGQPLEWLPFLVACSRIRIHWFSCYVFRTRDQEKKLFHWLTTPMVNQWNGFFFWSRVLKNVYTDFPVMFFELATKKRSCSIG